MTSLLTSAKQIDANSGYFIPVASLTGQIYGYNASNLTNNTGVAAGSFSTASWAYFGTPYLSSIQAGAGLLKDMGRTVVSSLRTFRKVQLVVPNSGAAPTANSTFGVAGSATALGQEYLTGYIELGFEGAGRPAPVASVGK